MGNFCTCCKKSIGMFSGENRILDDSQHVFCDRCFSAFGNWVRMLKNRDARVEIDEAYEQFSEEIAKIKIPADVRPIIIEETEKLYKLRLSICDAKRQNQSEEQRQEEEEQLSELAKRREKERRLRAMMLTTGFGFEGYRIVKYLGVFSGGVVQGTGFLSELSADINDIFGSESNTFSKKINMCREGAMEKLKMQALNVNANAIIGIDFETNSFRNNMIGIMVTGTAVIVEKIAD